MAASVVGSGTFSSPVVTPRIEVIVAVVGAPGICATVRTLPTRSTTAIVAGLRRALASLMACSTIVLTLASLRLGLVPAPVGAAGLIPTAGVKLPPPPPPPQPEGAAQSSDKTATAAFNTGWANSPDRRRAVTVRASCDPPPAGSPRRQRQLPTTPIVARATAAVHNKRQRADRKSTRLNSSHLGISYAV